MQLTEDVRFLLILLRPLSNRRNEDYYVRKLLHHLDPENTPGYCNSTLLLLHYLWNKDHLFVPSVLGSECILQLGTQVNQQTFSLLKQAETNRASALTRPYRVALEYAEKCLLFPH